jgi:glycosyltransferase involved in cell wall biosynthesis
MQQCLSIADNGESVNMRVCHVVDTMDMGGAERLVFHMCRMQRERGHEPSVRCILRVGVLGDELRRQGFDVQLQGPAHLHVSAKRFYSYFETARPDVVHCDHPTAAIYAAPAACMAGVPKILATRLSLVAPPYDRLREIKFSMAARFCDSVVGVCDATVNNLSQAPLAFRRNLTRIYNGAVPVRQNRSGGFAKNGFTLVHVGRLAAIKNQAMLLLAFSIARRSPPSRRSPPAAGRERRSGGRRDGRGEPSSGLNASRRERFRSS